MGGNGGSRTQELFPHNTHFSLRLGQLHEEPDRPGSKALGAVSELLWQPALHKNKRLKVESTNSKTESRNHGKQEFASAPPPSLSFAWCFVLSFNRRPFRYPWCFSPSASIFAFCVA